MDRWAWEQLDPWLEFRRTLPLGALFCVLRGPTRGRPCPPAGIRAQLHQAALAAGVRRRFAPHQLRHAHGTAVRRRDAPGRTRSERTHWRVARGPKGDPNGPSRVQRRGTGPPRIIRSNLIHPR